MSTKIISQINSLPNSREEKEQLLLGYIRKGVAKQRTLTFLRGGRACIFILLLALTTTIKSYGQLNPNYCSNRCSRTSFSDIFNPKNPSLEERRRAQFNRSLVFAAGLVASFAINEYAIQTQNQNLYYAGGAFFVVTSAVTATWTLQISTSQYPRR